MSQDPGDRRAIWGWAFYDWANSAFATTVMAGFFPLFFKAFWADPANPAQSTFILGWANSIASLMVAAAAPLLGAVADQGSSKKKFLAFFAALGAAATGGLWFVGQGQWLCAAALFVAATVGFMASNIFYDSLLPAVAPEGKLVSISSLGFALGYCGGGLLFAANVLMFLRPDLFGIPNASIAVRLSFLIVALWWALFTLPLLSFVREPRFHEAASFGKSLRLGWRQLKGTLKELRRLKVVGTFLLAYWLYIDGVDTIVRMAVDYGMAIGFPAQTLIIALLLVQFVAFPAALGYGALANRIGEKLAIQIAIGGYGLITLLAYFMREHWHFYLLAVLVGLFQGGVQAVSRSLYAGIIPKEKAAEFFGFYNMLGKFAAVIGPAMVGSITLLTGNPRLGILSVIILFVLGGALLQRVDIEEGRRMARTPLAK